MRILLTLSTYIGRQFLVNLAMVLAIISSIVLLLDGVETLRKAFEGSLPLQSAFGLVFLKFPFLIQEVFPFALLLGAILTFSRLTRSSELIVTRAAGVSVWQFMTPPIIIALTLGLFIMMVFNPLSSSMLSRFEALENQGAQSANSMLSISSSGLWLRQKNTVQNEKTIIHARKLNHETLTLYNITIFVLTNKNAFKKRIDASSAQLQEGRWLLENAVVTPSGQTGVKHNTLHLRTTLSIHQIQDSFAPPETLSFWELPAFISSLQEAGFSALRHLLHWHQLLTLPIFYAAMVLIAAAFSFRLPRRGKIGFMMTGGIMTGFVIYFITDIVAAIGLSGSIPVALSAWIPVSITLLIGSALMLHLEDG
jgi:lipopolysaccharide export system permease protein